MDLIFLILFLASLNWAECRSIKAINNSIEACDFCGQPLFLTPLIKSGNLKKARSKARVKNLPNAPEVESYSGYLTVNEEFNSNMFFWFFPSKVVINLLIKLKL